MRKKMYQFAFCLMLITNASFAQWAGSTGTTGITYRDGNVSIGTSGSISKFTIGLTQQNDGIWLGTNSTQNVALLANMTQGAWNGLTQPGDNMLLWKGSNIDQADAGALVIGTWCNGNKGIRILPTGNVGIGTPNPGSFKLAVEGTIGAREIKVTVQNPFPDYVFASNYKLRNLFSLEKYINQYKHLPGIPSAEEVKKEGGIQLGEMNVKLLEKIEELTLYVIELKKENEQMKKEIKELKK